MAASRIKRTMHELSHLGRALSKVLLYLYLPLAIVLGLLHYPYSTDSSLGQPPDHLKSARTYYEAAYRPTGASTRGVDYEETAAAAARKHDVEGTIRNFVTHYGLETRRVLEVGSGRGYLQDVVADYTGLDLSSQVATNYHKPFVVGSATDMPFPDDSFDAAWTVWVLEHIPTPERALEEMRRVVKPGGVIFLAPAWSCPPWLAGGFDVRPYSDFNVAGKLVKASIPLRRSAVFTFAHVLPVRLVRLAHYQVAGTRTALRFRRLEPNYEVYWQADSDAAVSLDRYESKLWFESRGDTCLNCGHLTTNLLGVGAPLVIRISK